MKKKKLTGLSLNKKKISNLTKSLTHSIKGGMITEIGNGNTCVTNYASCAHACTNTTCTCGGQCGNKQ